MRSKGRLKTDFRAYPPTTSGSIQRRTASQLSQKDELHCTCGRRLTRALIPSHRSQVRQDARRPIRLQSWTRAATRCLASGCSWPRFFRCPARRMGRRHVARPRARRRREGRKALRPGRRCRRPGQKGGEVAGRHFPARALIRRHAPSPRPAGDTYSREPAFAAIGAGDAAGVSEIASVAGFPRTTETSSFVIDCRELLIAYDPEPFEKAAFDGSDLEDLSELREEIADVVGKDTELVIGAGIYDENQRVLAGRLGITHAAARERYQRSLKRLEHRFARARRRGRCPKAPPRRRLWSKRREGGSP